MSILPIDHASGTLPFENPVPIDHFTGVRRRLPREYESIYRIEKVGEPLVDNVPIRILAVSELLSGEERIDVGCLISLPVAPCIEKRLFMHQPHHGELIVRWSGLSIAGLLKEQDKLGLPLIIPLYTSLL